MPTESSPTFFACAICPPSSARPASITCANGCGRHVCVEHARAVNPAMHGPMVCLECWERTYMSGRQELLARPASPMEDVPAWLRGMAESGHLPAPRTRRFGRMIMLLMVLALLVVSVIMFAVINLAR